MRFFASMYILQSGFYCLHLSYLLTVVCEILSAIHIAPYNFCYFFSCPSHSLFYLCIFGYILGLAALTLSGWFILSCLIAVTFLSPRSTQFTFTPDFSVLVSKKSCCSFVFFYYHYFYCSLPLLSHE